MENRVTSIPRKSYKYTPVLLIFLLLAFSAPLSSAGEFPSKGWYSISTDQLHSGGYCLLNEIMQLAKSSPAETRQNLEKYLELALRKAAPDAPPSSKSSIRTSRVYMDAWSNIYIFNRLYFNIPDSIKRRDQCFIGWELGGALLIKDRNNGDANIDAIYPLTHQDDQFKITGQFLSWVGADAYPVIEEFDLFLKKYGVRSR